MSNLILIDPETGQQNTKLPEYLAQCATLARNAYANGLEKYVCPRSKQEMKVHQIQTQDSSYPGVLLSYGGHEWECWSRGLSKKGNEYFSVRVRDPIFYGTNTKGLNNNPQLVAYGNLFVNVRAGKKEYNLSLISPNTLAKKDLADKIVKAGLANKNDIAALDSDIPADAQTRSSTVRLGT